LRATERLFSILNVRSEDLTTRARIRDAAIELFGSTGFSRTTVRGVAERAGVSPALVIHLFGSKDGLRDACDEYLVAEWVAEHETADGRNLNARLQEWLQDLESYRPIVDYLARTLADGGSAGRSLFDRLVDESRTMLDSGVEHGTMRRSEDPDSTALLLTVYGLAPLLLQHHVARHLGDDYLSSTSVRRLTLPVLDLFTHGIYTTDAVLEAARDALTSPDTSPGG
jgi:TetR/AcrR family transcriptional regulator, regulator of cefoperazone and chloramphenicol sensitivity